MKQIKLFLISTLAFLFFGCNSTEKKMELAVLVQLKEYPESSLQDIYKNFYQDRFGPGHAISNPESVMKYLENELSMMEDVGMSQGIELLGWEHSFVRVPLNMVKTGKINKEDLSQLFIESAFEIKPEAGQEWKKEWKQITKIIEKRKLPVKNFSEDKKYIDSLLNENPIIALHHSDAFRKSYHPHYRVVRKELFEAKYGNRF
jgi:polyhydroxyalkanoate synthesis regulator phasin